MKAGALPRSALAAWWLRWRFHLSALMLAVPLAYVPAYFSDLALQQGKTGLGERDLGERKVGPWTVRLAEFRTIEPIRQGEAGYMKGFALSLCSACVDEVKAAYLRVGRPRNIRTAGSIFFGAPYRQITDIPVPETTRPGAELWLTLEGWDGSIHQTTIPLAEASPVTAAWLARRGRR